MNLQNASIVLGLILALGASQPSLVEVVKPASKAISDPQGSLDQLN